MSLHRRITAAATLAVAAVCMIFGAVGYLYTRAKLFDEVRVELTRLAAPYLGTHHQGPGGGPAKSQSQAKSQSDGGGDEDDKTQSGASGGAANTPPGGDGGKCVAEEAVGDSGGDAALGGARGYFQSVCPNGGVLAFQGGTPELPVTPRVRAVARTLTGAFFFTAEVEHTHVEIYVTPDIPDRKAIEVAVPLTSTDGALRGLLVTYGLMIAAGVLLAGLIGALIARSALAPIWRFTNETEQVSSALDKPRRLEEHGAIELRRLAASFNQTLTALERSVQAQRHLIADASHELRTPMAALRSNIQIFLEAGELPEQEQAELRDAIVAELDELTQLVADVLELARGTTTGEHVEELELDAIVREAIDRARRRSPDLTFADELEPTVISNSAERVSRAVANVIDNARKWSPEGATIEIALRDGILTVRDHGPGFRVEDLPLVFDRFYRSDHARRMPGSGLGLAIVKQAAEAHGGFATAGNAPDGGAVLRVAFGPVRDAGPSATSATSATSAAREGSPGPATYP